MINMEKLLISMFNKQHRGFFPLPRTLPSKKIAFSTSISAKKLHRKPKTKKGSKAVKTIRDRMRVLVEKNELTTGFSLKKASHLLDLAQSRISYFRDKIYQNWNPDYLQQHSRPNKLDVVMDARWWIWNVAFALLPAILIAVYCEFRGKPLVEEYRKQQMEKQKNRMLGENRPADKTNTSAENDSGWSMTSLRNIISTRIPPEEDPIAENQLEKRIDSKQDGSATSSLPTTTSHGLHQVSIEALLQRIEQLELLVGASKPKNDVHDYGQSRIRSRAIADIKSRWGEESKKCEAPEAHKAGNAIDSIDVSEWFQMIKRTIGSIFHENSMVDGQKKQERENRGSCPDNQATAPDDKDTPRVPVKIHEDNRGTGGPIGRTADDPKQPGVETMSERPWWKVW